MAIQFSLDSISGQHALAPVASQALVPVAPSTLALPTGVARQVDAGPYLATPLPNFTESVLRITDLVGYLRRHLWLGVITAVPAAALCFYLLGMGPNIYQAEAKLRLRLQDSNVFNFSEMARAGVTELSAPMLINNHLTEIKSRRFVDFFHDRLEPAKRDRFIALEKSSLGRKDQLLKMAGLYKPPPPGPAREIFAGGLEEAVRVEAQKESHILRIQVRGRDAKLTADIANSYAQEYMRFFGEQEAHQTRGGRDYLQKKAEELRRRLEESERELAEYRKSENLIQESETKDMDAEKVRLLTTAITDAELRLVKANSDLRTIKEAQLAGRDLTEVKVIADNPEVAFSRKELEAKTGERKALEPQCGPRHPQMVSLASEIQIIRAALERSINAVVAMTEADVAGQQRQIADYQKQIDSARGNALEQSGKNVRQSLLRDQVTTDRQMYQETMLRLKQADLTGQFEESGALSLADVATPPDKPVKPNKMIAAVASALAFGMLFLGVPVGWGLFDEHVWRVFRNGGSPSVNIPSATHAPMPAAFPAAVSVSAAPGPFSFAQALPQAPPAQPAYVPVAPQVPMPQTTYHPPAPAVAPLAGLNGAQVLARLPIVQAATPEAALAQLLRPEPQGAAGALHQIIGNLEKHALNRGGLAGIILITSAESGEGKTVAASALAAAFCHLGRSVFMMECNAVNPALHQWFPRSSRHSSWAHDLQSLRYGNTNLFLLPAHDLPAHATNELLDGYRSWIDRARTQVDWIILDAGPILRNFADVAPLAPLATDVLMVYNPNVGGPAKLKAALSLLQPMMSASALRGLILHGP